MMKLLKLLKVLSMSFALFLIGISTTIAQTRANNLSEEQKEEIKRNLEEYATALSLSDDQRPIFEEITKKYAKQLIDVKDGGGRRMSKYKKVKSIRKNKDAEMKKLLSKDQYKVYLEKQKEIQKKMKKGR